jgi:antitoxin component YwqK of YwqJK toxin-antitoxin module
MWYENGQKAREMNLKADKLMSAEVWKPNGEKCPVTNVVDGNGVIVWYKDDGTEELRQTYKDGELVKD